MSADARERGELTQVEHAYVVSAAKFLLDALNINDPFYALLAWERLEPVALRERQRQAGEEES